MASAGLRVLGLAVRHLLSHDEAQAIATSNDSAKSECELVFVGLIGLIDPPRHGVKNSIDLCHKAGINVIMITGDHIVTAAAIATSLGILDPHTAGQNRAVKGVEVDMLSDDQLKCTKPFPNVFARVSPDNKLRIVKALQAQGQ